MTRPWREAGAWIGLLLCVAAAHIGVVRWVFDGPPGAEAAAAGALLGVNYIFFMAARLLPLRGGVWTEPFVGLIWVSLKLFVNTFTIFLFIGLHAGRTHVFVVQFFVPYLVLLFGSVGLLNRKT